MANRLQHLRQLGLAAAGALVLGATGCALPNGVTGGDPILGNFNRPIVPTPPPERGGLGLDSPAYDAGARIGVGAPDIATPVENTGGGMSLPQLTSPGQFSGARLTLAGGADEPYLAQRPADQFGARLPIPQDRPAPRPPAFGRTSPDSMAGRVREPEYSVPGGLAFVAPTPGVRPAAYETLKDPAMVKTMEDAQVLLQAAGANGQKVEQLAGGEWVFGCSVGIKTYEARGSSALEAMKVALKQIQKDR
jgi:hypothetical protein